MRKLNILSGKAAALPIENLDTDQIMPKQFLHGIDKAGLDKGLLYDLRHDAQGLMRADFVLNRPERAGTEILVAGANFGCGSSREHAVWGLQQFGIQAVIAPSFGEIFYSNAMNNQLLLVMLPEADIAAMMADAKRPETAEIAIDIEHLRVRSASVDAGFTLSARHQRMQLEGLDVIGLSMTYEKQIEAFAARHWQAQPWVKDVAARTMAALRAGES
ncbi:3-isopropylmalate dehydratase small subunit [Acidovorax sp. CCYZU-2555]|uniref:3-isopropylmalate dehydratase small subunit n=1 Tax=Acidovorax sp. CCYZU-2555 TaxID=2835042 RepID=UPI001BCC7830|nr:3-isopropylmalate dehydratase small subunit [Acidovorax sp. CCYZU-2555]MBS7776474.1 3-isopropylmalate dehydratase small subunit [Acidovorax sp. CCYZU-2555]